MPRYRNPTIDTRFAAAFAAWRAARGWTQVQAAEIIGVNVATIHNWEAARNLPRRSQSGRLLELGFAGVQLCS